MLTLWSFSYNLFEQLDREIYNLKLTELSPPQKNTSESNIFIVLVNEAEAKDNRLLAQLLDTIMQQGASLSAFEFVLNETNNISIIERANGQFISEQQLLTAKVVGHDAVLGFHFLDNEPIEVGLLVANYFIHLNKSKQPPTLAEQAGYITSPAMVQTATQGSGFLNLKPDSDGILRRASLIKSYQDRLFPSFPLALSMTYLVRSGMSLETISLGDKIHVKHIKLAEKYFFTDHNAQVFIPFNGNEAKAYPSASARQVLNHPQPDIAGRIVLIAKEEQQQKQFKTPFGSLSSTQVQAKLIDTLLHEQFLYQPAFSKLAKIVVLLILTLLLSILMPKVSKWVIGLLTLGSIALIYSLEAFLFLQNIHLGMSLIVLFILLIGITQLLIARRFEQEKYLSYQASFGQKLAPSQVKTLNKNNWGSTLAEYKPLSLLRIAYPPWEAFVNKQSAEQQQSLQNQFLTAITTELVTHSGTLANYHYDGLSAYWGAPLEEKEHANHAVACSLAMRKTLYQLLRDQRVGWPKTKDLQIGLHESTFLVGDFGSQQYHSYRIKGQGLETSLKLSRLNQEYGTQILASERIYLGANNYVFRYIDTVYLDIQDTNNSEHTRLYEPICLRKDKTKALTDELKDYEYALGQYLQQRWYSAGIGFDKLMEDYPKQKLYRLYRKRVHDLATQQVPKNWRGEYPLKTR